jgi:hypothetical protein
MTLTIPMTRDMVCSFGRFGEDGRAVEKADAAQLHISAFQAVIAGSRLAHVSRFWRSIYRGKFGMIIRVESRGDDTRMTLRNI